MKEERPILIVILGLLSSAISLSIGGLILTAWLLFMLPYLILTIGIFLFGIGIYGIYKNIERLDKKINKR